MIFHWIQNDALNTCHIRTIIFGHAIKGIRIKNRQPDYVIITKQEVEKWWKNRSDPKEETREKFESYMMTVRMGLKHVHGESIPIFIND